jgi:hypothetical protein
MASREWLKPEEQGELSQTGLRLGAPVMRPLRGRHQEVGQRRRPITQPGGFPRSRFLPSHF